MPKEARVFVSRVRHEGAIVEPEPRHGHPAGGRGCGDDPDGAAHGSGHRNRPRGGRQRAPRLSPGVPGRGYHEQGPRGKNLSGAGGHGIRPGGLSAQAPPGGGADALHRRDPDRPGRRAEPGRGQARCGTGGEGAGVRGPAGDHHRHDLRRAGYLFRRAGRSAHGHHRRPPDHPHGQRRRPGDGPGLRVAPVRYGLRSAGSPSRPCGSSIPWD